MQFIQNGPDIPDSLLQAHEEGRVVFFCGAGISYPAGLPNFKGLVNEIYQTIGTIPEPFEKRAIEKKQFDAALDLLEHRLPGNRIAVRTALARVLKPKLRRKGATETHAALLELARSREGAIRLVTTNFDRIFQSLIDKKKLAITAYSAPQFPIPKSSRWNGLVYLHGLLPKKVEESALNRLVLTSGDFGLAYLTERWAARFVSELFRNYIVCFVGYSIDDPVLRYMMDALAADRMLGETTPQAYAFGGYEHGTMTDETIEWEAKGVAPILFEVSKGADYSLLHKTLKAWAETYRDGVAGKERIVVDYAMTRPSASTKQDDFVGRMLWALSQDTGLPAKKFADFDPVPSIDWLEALSDNRYSHDDLSRFGVPPKDKKDKKLTFSIASRPTPYTLAPMMTLTTWGRGGWDNVMFHIGRWLIRHLNDPVLVLWIAQRGGRLHDQFVWLIEAELEKINKIEKEGNYAELDRIRANAPNAIPNSQMRTIWRLLLTGRVRSSTQDIDLYRWKEHLKRDGLTTTLRLQLRKLLAPMLILKKPFRWDGDSSETTEQDTPKKLVDWDLVLNAEYVHSTLIDFKDTKNWQKALPIMVDDFQQLLRDALDLFRELGDAEDKHDPAYWHLPSISPHWQNRGFEDWVALVELLRDAWLAQYEESILRAQQIALNWNNHPYPTFKRLALFAATYEGIASDGEWVDWLLADNGWWLWSVETQRETLRLLVLQGSKLSDVARDRLEVAILVGPPREMFRDDIELERWQDIIDHSIWLRLAKLQSGHGQLSKEASEKYGQLSEKYPNYKVAEDERDEFSSWMSGTGDPDYEVKRVIEKAPRTRKKLVNWLKSERKRGPFDENDWRQICSTRFSLTATALYELARHGHWPVEYWREALQAWSEEKLIRRSWRYMAPILQTMPADKLVEVSQTLTWWLESVAKVFDINEEMFFNLCRRVLEIAPQDGTQTDRPVTSAINHPVGRVTQALLHFWFRSKPDDNQGLPSELQAIFSSMCNTQIEQYRHARVLLSANLVALFRVDPEWATKILLPLLNWQSSNIEAKSAWEGFLWSPRLYPPLVIAFKQNFLNTARHYNELGEHSRQYVAILTYAGLEPRDIFTNAELREAIGALPQEGLNECAHSMTQALESADEQREQYWKNRIYPFWKNIWPKSNQFMSKAISGHLANMAIAARREFPAALSMIKDWLQSIDHPSHTIRLLQESGLCTQFPKDSLALLDAIVDDQTWCHDELVKCLNAIEKAWPEASHDYRYKRLMDNKNKK
jgi:hypothetical protein